MERTVTRSVEMERGFAKDGQVGARCLPTEIRKRLYDGAPETMTGTLLFIPEGETEGAVDALFANVERLLACAGPAIGETWSRDLEECIAAARAERVLGEGRVRRVRYFDDGKYRYACCGCGDGGHDQYATECHNCHHPFGGFVDVKTIDLPEED